MQPHISTISRPSIPTIPMIQSSSIYSFKSNDFSCKMRVPQPASNNEYCFLSLQSVRCPVTAWSALRAPPPTPARATAASTTAPSATDSTTAPTRRTRILDNAYSTKRWEQDEKLYLVSSFAQILSNHIGIWANKIRIGLFSYTR